MNRKEIEAEATTWLERKGYISSNEKEKVRLMTGFAISLLSDRWTEVKSEEDLPKDAEYRWLTLDGGAGNLFVRLGWYCDTQRAWLDEYDRPFRDYTVIAFTEACAPAPFTPPAAEGGE